MTADEFDGAHRGFCRRRPFRPFVIEFFSGERLTITHPEAVVRRGAYLVYRGPDRTDCVFVASSVCRLLDPSPAGG